jgi:predicted small lipoprotein YifL
MRVLRYLQVLAVMAAVSPLAACGSTGGYHHPDDVVAVSATWDSGPIDRDYQGQLNDMEVRHGQEAAHPVNGETSVQMATRQTAEHQDLNKRYAQASSRSEGVSRPDTPST